VVPLTMVAYPAIDDLRRGRLTAWAARYKWPVYFFVAVAFWNMVGAGLFGFMINPPIALYFMQGLNTTPLHGHAALFGVYWMRVPGDTVFALGALVLVAFVFLGRSGKTAAVPLPEGLRVPAGD